MLIVGNTPITRELLIGLHNTRVTGYKVVGVVTTAPHELPTIPSNRRFDSFEKALYTLKDNPFHSIVQTELYVDQDKNSELLQYAQANHVAYRFVPGNSELFTGKLEVSLFQNIPVIAVHQTALVGWGRVAKRLFDIIVATFVLILLSPLFIGIYVVVALSGKGGAIFRQARLTRYNATIKIFKFRTHKFAYNGLLPEEAFAKMGKPHLALQYRKNGDFLENDPRVSRVGAFLRKTSLDELPQLLNVIKGDLSLVGPRALVERDLDRAHQKNLILSVKSGLTGLAVISGRKELPFE